MEVGFATNPVAMQKQKRTQWGEGLTTIRRTDAKAIQKRVHEGGKVRDNPVAMQKKAKRTQWGKGLTTIRAADLKAIQNRRHNGGTNRDNPVAMQKKEGLNRGKDSRQHGEQMQRLREEGAQWGRIRDNLVATQREDAIGGRTHVSTESRCRGYTKKRTHLGFATIQWLCKREDAMRGRTHDNTDSRCGGYTKKGGHNGGRSKPIEWL